MLRIKNNFHQNKPCKIFAVCYLLFAICGMSAASAADVIARPTAATPARPSILRQSAVRTAPKAPVVIEETESISESETVPPEPEPIITPDIPVANKSSDFATIFSDTNTGGAQTNSTMAEQIRAQRAAFDAAERVEQGRTAASTLGTATANACDSALRACMIGKCGNDFEKCAGDGDTIFGDKMESCRRNIKCTGREFTLFSTQIKDDRDANAMFAGFNEILNCGTCYNQCILEKCGGMGFGKCLSKAGGDAAVAACKSLAQNDSRSNEVCKSLVQKCQTADSGLASRAMELFGNLRVDTEKNIASWEKQLYALRDKMSADCTAGGGMFDSASFDCVFTVEMNAQGWDHPVATKKLFAGQNFMCTENWFGVDITTFKENAARLTRSQTGASSAFLGAGLGVAAGAISSGAIGRAIDRFKADKALTNELKKELPPAAPEATCEDPYKDNPDGGPCVCINGSDSDNCENASEEEPETPVAEDPEPTPEVPTPTPVPQEATDDCVDPKQKNDAGECECKNGEKTENCEATPPPPPPPVPEETISMPGDALFASGRTTVMKGKENLLTNWADTMKGHITKNKNLCFLIGGYSDNDKIDPKFKNNKCLKSNLALSECRAESVKNVLINKGVPANNLSHVEYGDAGCSAKTAAEKAACRKITFQVSSDNDCNSI
ncbi:MAG: OmpA family protein [Rickettsiales bacterium]|jgi:outer membrane protein OmpA-like peptidoglycan-associated protein|nr:OmpA family protein [Rickettsiales bacterium]